MAFFEAAHEDRRRRDEEQNLAVRQQIADFGPLTGKAQHGGVTVEAGSGGMLQRLEIAPAAMSRGAASLRADILTAAKKATARANHRAQQAFGKAIGNQGIDAARSLGLTYDPELLEDDEPQQQGWRR